MGRGRARAGLTGNESKKGGTPNNSSAMVSGSDLTGEFRLQADVTTLYGEKGRDLAMHSEEINSPYSERILALAKQYGLHARSGDLAGAVIAKRQGFDGPATLVSKAEMDKAVAAGALEMYRGLGSERSRNDLLTGQHFNGVGIYGNGMYTAAVTLGRTQDWAKSEAYGYGAAVTRMALKPGAKVATGEQFDEARYAQRGSGFSDIGHYLAAKGYDAYHTGRTGVNGYMVVLNRTALIMQREAP